jgi:hypothetical protein
LELLNINHNDLAPTAEASRLLPAHIAAMANLRHYSLAGNRWAYEEVAEGANAATAAASAAAEAEAAALGSSAHYTYPVSRGSAAVDVQLTFPGLTSAWFCASCAALPDFDGAFLSESVRQECVQTQGAGEPCGDKELFAAARCVLRELLPMHIIAEAGATVSSIRVYEVADTAAGHAALGLRVTVSTPAAAAAAAKALKRHQANGASVAVPVTCVAAAGAAGRAMAAPDARPTLSARQACPVGHFGPRCDYFCAAKWSRTNTDAAFLGHHPASSHDFNARSETPAHHLDSRFPGRRKLHAGPPSSSSSEPSLGVSLGGSAHTHITLHDPPSIGRPAVHFTHDGAGGDRPRCTNAQESTGDMNHCDMSFHRNAYHYAPEAGDPDEGFHTPSTSFAGCHRNCAGHAKRAMAECFEWMDDKSHGGERKRCREGLVDMMRECQLYASDADAAAAMAAVLRGEQDFANPCAGVGYTRSSHDIRDTHKQDATCEVCGVSHW